MTTVKTAISIQESLFDEVDNLAEELQVSRSQIFALAVDAFIKQHENRRMLEKLNEVYADVSDTEEAEAVREARRQKHRQQVMGQW
ncbi:MAG TPA: ribbon-helix-helix protein, CopG family [Chloroflexi bacterium]|nr:ribbon-helix-helix protein, CopG family [Chloroflexota bacterium]